jgi:hypothetical protein
LAALPDPDAVVEVVAGFVSDLVSLFLAPALEPLELSELESLDRESVL